jgi:regulator of RNase E activity RraA
MIETPPLLTIQRAKRRPTSAQVAAFTDVATGFVVDALMGGGALGGGIAPLGGPLSDVKAIAGPALTASNGPGDILATLAAIHLVQTGDILVATCDAWQGCAAAGDRVSGMVRNAGGAALISDGPVRDIDGIHEVGLPLWCTGLNPNTPQETGPGQVGLPIIIGGQRVETGDMVIADRDGVVVVPFEQLDEVIAHLDTVRALETDLDQRIRDGFCEPVTELLASDQVKWV